jgi:hypothetical protein
VRLFAIAALAAAAAAMPASGAPADRTLRSSTAVIALGATAGDVAYATEGAGDLCGQIHIWRTATRATIVFPRPLRFCEETSTGTGIAGVTTGGGRVLWLSYTGGNYREWRLYTASVERPRPREVEFLPADAEDPSPIVLGRPAERLLPFAVGARAVVLRPNGSRAFVWNAGAQIRALAANVGRVAVLLANGRVVVLSAAGATLAEYSDYARGAVRSIRSSSRGVVLELAAAVEIRNGSGRTTVPLPPAARLLDFVENRILYARGRQVRAIRLADRTDVLLRTAGPTASPSVPVLAQLTRAGLAYVRGGAVSWAPWRLLPGT